MELWEVAPIPPPFAPEANTTTAPTPPSEAVEGDDDEPHAAPAVTPARREMALDDEKWKRAVDAVRQASPRHGKSLSCARFLGLTADTVRIAFPADAAFHRSQVLGMSRQMVEAELSKSLGRAVRLVEDTSAQALEGAPQSLAEIEASDRSNRERSIEDKVRAHPALLAILRHLGGTLEHIAYLEPAPRQPTKGASEEGDGGPPVD